MKSIKPFTRYRHCLAQGVALLFALAQAHATNWQDVTSAGSGAADGLGYVATIQVDLDRVTATTVDLRTQIIITGARGDSDTRVDWNPLYDMAGASAAGWITAQTTAWGTRTSAPVGFHYGAKISLYTDFGPPIHGHYSEESTLEWTVDIVSVAGVTPTEQKSNQDRLNNNTKKDPVQLATGAESRERKLFSFSGARNWQFSLGYNSRLGLGQSALQPLGRGWTHNFQASVAPSGANLIVQWNAGSSNVFTPTVADPNTYTSSEDGSRYDTIVAQSGGGWLLTRRDQSSLLFNASGRLIEDRDPHGRKLTLSYTGTQLTGIIDPVSGTSLTLAYDTNGMLQTLTDGTTATVQLGYQVVNGSRILTQITNQDAKNTTYSYDSYGKMTTVTDHTSSVILANVYDVFNRVTSQQDGVSGHAAAAFGYSTVAGQPVTTYTDANGKQEVQTFDANFNPLTVKDALNHTTTYTYDAANRVTSVTDPLTRTTGYTYDAQGNLLTVTDPAGKVTTYTYDSHNNLLTTTDAASQVTTRTYDSSNNLLTVTDALGRATTWTYDSNSLPLTMTLPGGGVYHYTYTNGRLTTATDPNGVATNFSYDANGRLLYREDALGKRVTFTYDAVGNVLTVTNALSQATTYAYDHRNRVTSLTEPTGAVTSYTYDSNSNVLTSTDALGKVTTYTYDGENRLKTVVDALSRTTTYDYDDAGRLTSIVAPGSLTTTYAYDAAGQLTSVTDPAGKTTTTAYNSRGLLTDVTDPLSRTSQFTYDDIGRRITTKDPLNRQTGFEYDALNRLKKVTDPGSLVAEQGFDLDGNRSSLKNPAANTTAFAYDVGGRLTTTTTPEGHATGYTYNSRGLPATVVEPSTQTTTLTYDDAQRLSSMTDPVGTISLTRDADGRVLTVVEGSKTLTRAYDALGRLTAYTDGDGNVMGYTYDDIGRLTKLTYPGTPLKEVNYAYDTAGHLGTVTDWASRVTTYSYDAVGRMTQLLRPNGTKQVRTYDDAGQLRYLTELAPDGTTILYNGSHTYDAAGQLTGESIFPAITPAIISHTQTFDTDNRLLTHNSAATTFDADGNLLSLVSGLSPSSYTYDARNRLTSAGGLTYGYNAENRRVSITDSGGTTTFAVNPNAVLDQVLVRTTPDGTKTFYVYGLGLLHEETGSAVRYYHHDRRGDTVALTDGSGAVTDRASYSVYGELLSRTGTANTPFLFNGAWGVQTDASGIYYHRARYYHPQLRRFINQDVVLGVIDETESLNRFAYANSNPVSFIDPLGLKIEIYGTPKYIAQVKSDLERIKNASPPLRELVRQLEESDKTHMIVNTDATNGANATTYGRWLDNFDTKVHYDPNNRFGWDERNPVDGLVHELGHAIDADWGVRNFYQDQKDPKWQDMEEFRAVRWENIMRKALGEKERTCY